MFSQVVISEICTAGLAACELINDLRVPLPSRSLNQLVIAIPHHPPTPNPTFVPHCLMPIPPLCKLLLLTPQSMAHTNVYDRHKAHLLPSLL